MTDQLLSFSMFENHNNKKRGYLFGFWDLTLQVEQKKLIWTKIEKSIFFHDAIPLISARSCDLILSVMNFFLFPAVRMHQPGSTLEHLKDFSGISCSFRPFFLDKGVY